MKLKLTKRNIDEIGPIGARLTVWDTELAGFGPRITPAGVKTFVVRYRAEGGGRTAEQRQMPLGRFGVLTPEIARREARAVLGAVAQGDDAAGKRMASRRQITLAELCDQYIEQGILQPTGRGTVKGVNGKGRPEPNRSSHQAPVRASSRL